jgi:MFS family permease
MVWANRDMKKIVMSMFLLQFFYAWMIIYMPIYLNQTVGFDWTTIGFMFAIMLVPFVILEAPLGRLADSRYGEKEMLSIGFIIMAIAVAAVAFFTDHNVIVWTAILFVSRVGAAITEVMTETYFFKKVDASNTHLISFARMTRPLAYVIGPVIATILLTIFDIKGLFIFLAFLMLYGLRYSLSLVDTK